MARPNHNLGLHQKQHQLQFSYHFYNVLLLVSNTEAVHNKKENANAIVTRLMINNDALPDETHKNDSYTYNLRGRP